MLYIKMGMGGNYSVTQFSVRRRRCEFNSAVSCVVDVRIQKSHARANVPVKGDSFYLK